VVYLGSLYRHSGGLTELNKLNNLRGKLEIGDLRHGKDVMSKHKAADLKEKKHLHAGIPKEMSMIQTLLMINYHWKASNHTQI
jgi:hypothetical protein